MTKLLLFGLGDYAKVALHYFKEEPEIEPVAFVVGREYIKEKEYNGLPVIAFEDVTLLYPPDRFKMMVTIGPGRINTNRERIYNEAIAKGYELITYVSPKAIVAPGVKIGMNSFIFEGVTLEPFVEIGNNTVIWSNTIIAHHSVVGDNCFLAPAVAISGRSVIGDNCFLGINSTIIDHVNIGSHGIIGAGAIIKKDTQPHGVYSPKGTGLRYEGTGDVHL